jgi:hypothetical protein
MMQLPPWCKRKRGRGAQKNPAFLPHLFTKASRIAIGAPSLHRIRLQRVSRAPR